MAAPAGAKSGSGQITGAHANEARRERLRQLAMETIDLKNDPYFMKNHLGQFECKLCLTLHNTEANYLSHTQGKKHTSNLARRAHMEAKTTGPAAPVRARPKVAVKKTVKIGRPGYKVTRERDPSTNQLSLRFEISYPEIVDGLQPLFRFMGAYEQRVEAPNKDYQYLLFAAEPYETIGFKIPKKEIDKDGDKFYTNWDWDTLVFTLQLSFKVELTEEQVAEAAAAKTRSAPNRGLVSASVSTNPLNPYAARA